MFICARTCTHTRLVARELKFILQKAELALIARSPVIIMLKNIFKAIFFRLLRPHSDTSNSVTFNLNSLQLLFNPSISKQETHLRFKCVACLCDVCY